MIYTESETQGEEHQKVTRNYKNGIFRGKRAGVLPRRIIVVEVHAQYKNKSSSLLYEIKADFHHLHIRGCVTLCVISETDKGVYVLPKLIKTKIHRFRQHWSRESKEINGYFRCPGLIGLPQGNSSPTPRSNVHRTASLPLGAQ